jgi:cytochrome d ubiquinol oxidase subunit I
MTGAAFVAGVSLWLLVKRARDDADRDLYRTAARTAAGVVLVAGLGVAVSGDFQGKIMTDVQPMKMAAAEALYDTEQPASFSILTIGTLDGSEEKFSIKVPRLLSWLATGTWDGEVQGINQLREQYEETYGQDPGAAYYSPSGYVPVIWLTYWTFRLMIGLGVAGAVVGAWILWATRRRRMPGTWVVRAAIVLPLLPLFANSAGWIFTEAGRQPWVVFGLMTTANGVSPSVSWQLVLTSMVGLTLLYGALAFVEVRLLLTYIKKGAKPIDPDDVDSLPSGPTSDDAPLAHAY